MKNYEKTLMVNLTDNIEKLCKEQADRQSLVYEMFTKLEGKIQLLEHKIGVLEAKIDSINLDNNEEIIPVRRDCSLCTIS